MKPTSSWKFFYRYKVLTFDDFLENTWHRRFQKFTQTSCDLFLIDLTDFSITQTPLEFKNIFDQFIFQISKAPGLIHFEFLLLSAQKQIWLPLLPKENPVHFQIRNQSEWLELDLFLAQNLFQITKINIHLAPKIKADLVSFEYKLLPSFKMKYYCYFWSFQPYNPKIKKSLTTKDIGFYFQSAQNKAIEAQFTDGALKGLEIWNDQIPNHYELEPLVTTSISTPSAVTEKLVFQSSQKNIKISIIIPSYNNSLFLTNTLYHLLQQTAPYENYEIIIVDDGSTDHSDEIIHSLFQNYQTTINLKWICWKKEHPTKGPQKFFRAGLARNLGVQFSSAENLFFLDSDMLVPKNFIEMCLLELQKNDVIQFQRVHIHQNLSLTKPFYSEIKPGLDTYIEDEAYWNKLFQCKNWSHLPDYWKYTCTYALGIKKNDFLTIGRFKKYYISYGCEDTDLGYELFKRHKKFKFVPITLYHQTAYNQMNYKNSYWKRVHLLKKTSSLLYFQHLNNNIFTTFLNFYRFEKSWLQQLKDLF